MPKAPAFGALHRLQESEDRRSLRGSALGEPSDLLAIAKGEHLPRAPIEVGWVGGSTPCDFLWTDGPVLCVTDRVVSSLQSLQVTGWQLYPVKVLTRAGRHLKKYSGLAIQGRSAPYDFGNSQRIARITAAGRGTVHVGRFFDRDDWDGSDLFRPDHSSDIIATDRGRRAISGISPSNVELRPLDIAEVSSEEMERWNAPRGDYFPGRR